MFTQLSPTLCINPAGSLPVFDSLLQNFPGMAYRCLIDYNWSMQYVSAGAELLTGYPPKTFLANWKIAFADIILADDRQRVQQEIARALSEGRPFSLTYRIIAADGTVKWVNEHGNAIRDHQGQVLALQGFLMDVTAQQQAQQALDEATQRFKLIAQATNDGIWDWDLRTNRSWWSNGIQILFGISPNAMTAGSESWTDLIHPEDKEQVLAGLHDALASRRTDWSAEYRLQRKDGSYAEIFDRSSIFRDEIGTAIRMVGGVSDLTERKQSELRQARLNRALHLLSQCNELLVRAVDEQTLLADICRVVVEAGGYRAAWVGFADEDAQRSVQPAASHGVSLGFLNRKHISWSEEQWNGSGPTGTAIRSGAPVICRDVATDPLLARWRKDLLDNGYRSGIWLPLAYAGHTLGIFAIYLGAPASLADEEMRLLQTLADNLAFGIANMRSRQERMRIEQAAVKIAAGVSAATGEAFLEQLARNMAHAVDADAAFVTQFQDGQMQSTHTVAAIVNNQVVPNFEYAIIGSPCERIVTSASCVVLDDVGHCFPASGAAKMGMQSYVGCRLNNAAGQPLGLLFALFRERVLEPDFVAQTIQIFAARAASELERRVSDARICEQASLLDKAKDAIVVYDISGRITFWNEGAQRLYGRTNEEVLGTCIDTVIYASRERYQSVIASLGERDEWQDEITYQRQDGVELTVEINSTLVRDACANPSSVLSIITDITRRKAAEQEVTYLAFHDRVTGLPNRHCLMKRLDHLLSGDANAGKGALLWIDLDGLKILNDTHGHNVGDLMLRQVGTRITESIEKGDMTARVGGDEFVVVLTDCNDDVARATLLAQRLLQRLSEPFDLDGYIHRGSASIGLAYFNCGQDTAGEILKRADLAMYEAKAAGRNSLRLFDAQMQQLLEARIKLEEDLRSALPQEQMHLAYQPQVTESGQVIGVEALLRWNHPVRGPVSPAEFIPLAEANGLIIAFGQWVLEQACIQLKRWESDPVCQSLSISVNVSVHQIRQHDFVDQMLQTIRSTGIDPRKLKLEMTESTLVTDAEATVARMAALKEVGIQFSLDDFGTGYSSLLYLKRLPLNQLKIDRSFIIDVMTDPNAAVIVRTVIALGQSLGLEVIAEGVETEAQRQFLASHGCAAYQGYLFSRPLAVEALENHLTSFQRWTDDREYMTK